MSLLGQAYDAVRSLGRALLDEIFAPPKQRKGAALSELATRMASKATYYETLRSYHEGSVDAFRGEWMRSRGYGALPVNVRSISSIAPAVAEWWSDNLFGSAWTADGLQASDGRQNVIAYDDAPEEVRLAVQQAFTWGGDVLNYIRSDVPKLGNGLVEIQDSRSFRNGVPNPPGNDVHPVWIPPDYVAEVEFSDQGFIRSYRLAIPQVDPETGKDFTYGKIVTRDEFITLKDDHEFSYNDQPSRQENIFGYVPAAWFAHRPVIAGSYFGIPAIHYGIATINAYQAQLSDMADYMARLVRQPVMVETDDPEEMIKYMLLMRGHSGAAAFDAGMEAELRAMRDREEIKYQPVPAGTIPHNIMQDLGLAASDAHIARTWNELELIFPEVVLDRNMASKTQLTGPAAEFLISRVQTKLSRHAEAYNRSIVRVGQMCCTMGGVLIRNGDWGLRSQLTRNQQKFLPFDLNSFDDGELDFGLRVPQLKPLTRSERADEAIKIESITTPEGLRIVGYSDAEIYGTDAQGNSLVPDPRPGILQQSTDATAPTELQASVGDALQRALNTGVTP